MTARPDAPHPGKTVVILGGGTGGLVAANRLRRMLNREHGVVLVDRSPQYSFAPSYTRVMLGERSGDRITRDLGSLEKKGITFIRSEVTAIDGVNKRVRIGEEELAYDYLVIALGARYSSDEIPGLGQTWTFYHLDGAEGLAEKLPSFKSGRIAVVISSLPYKCPAAPYEGSFLLDDYFRRRKQRADVEISLFTPEAMPLPAAGAQVGERVLALLSEREIGFTGSAQLTEVDHDAGELRFANGVTAPFDLVVATPVHSAPTVLRNAGLCGDTGWVAVDRETLATQFEDVYAIGDATQISLGDGLALPKTGVFAHGQAEVVARNIAAEIDGGQAVWAFGGQGGCFMSSGKGKTAYVEGNFYAEPRPEVAMRGPNRRRHWAKTGYERIWLWRWF